MHYVLLSCDLYINKLEDILLMRTSPYMNTKYITMSMSTAYGLCRNIARAKVKVVEFEEKYY